ncbi:hypothetical protein BU26DRAFT_556172 [Trematosphaeria pertusa]|uniref:Uncharacterized protein n=1 Tax=Trematosphaeria pertusa TaxID=390896 RepID=A0A6A6HUZ1_9PLEO|nr:uncharacterized protein BU26DRAFT_556172 [Trematosphaeria pertusa]KAF2241373.1 hypothetical protein BU26DRAFT_556172 [Trematosphaeria pertusa]
MSSGVRIDVQPFLQKPNPKASARRETQQVQLQSQTFSIPAFRPDVHPPAPHTPAQRTHPQSPPPPKYPPVPPQRCSSRAASRSCPPHQPPSQSSRSPPSAPVLSFLFAINNVTLHFVTSTPFFPAPPSPTWPIPLPFRSSPPPPLVAPSFALLVVLRALPACSTGDTPPTPTFLGTTSARFAPQFNDGFTDDADEAFDGGFRAEKRREPLSVPAYTPSQPWNLIASAADGSPEWHGNISLAVRDDDTASPKEEAPGLGYETAALPDPETSATPKGPNPAGNLDADDDKPVYADDEESQKQCSGPAADVSAMSCPKARTRSVELQTGLDIRCFWTRHERSDRFQQRRFPMGVLHTACSAYGSG